MTKNSNISIILLALFMGFAGTAECGVVIKVRAINPLEKKTPVTIHYPLPAGITAEDVIGKRISRGKGPSRPADFQINFDESEKVYFVDDRMTLAPKEIVVLEVEANDVWVVPQKTVDGLKSQVEDLLKSWPRGEEGPGPDPVVIKLKEEIFRQLEQVLMAQKENAITQVGVQGHIDAYQKNREILQQVGMDIAMLRNMTSARPAGSLREEVQKEEEKSQGGNEIQSETPSSSPESVFTPAASGPAGPAPAPAPTAKPSVADKLKSFFKWK